MSALRRVCKAIANQYPHNAILAFSVIIAWYGVLINVVAPFKDSSRTGEVMSNFESITSIALVVTIALGIFASKRFARLVRKGIAFDLFSAAAAVVGVIWLFLIEAGALPPSTLAVSSVAIAIGYNGLLLSSLVACSGFSSRDVFKYTCIAAILSILVSLSVSFLARPLQLIMLIILPLVCFGVLCMRFFAPSRPGPEAVQGADGDEGPEEGGALPPGPSSPGAAAGPDPEQRILMGVSSRVLLRVFIATNLLILIATFQRNFSVEMWGLYSDMTFAGMPSMLVLLIFLVLFVVISAFPEKTGSVFVALFFLVYIIDLVAFCLCMLLRENFSWVLWLPNAIGILGWFLFWPVYALAVLHFKTSPFRAFGFLILSFELGAAIGLVSGRLLALLSLGGTPDFVIILLISAVAFLCACSFVFLLSPKDLTNLLSLSDTKNASADQTDDSPNGNRGRMGQVLIGFTERYGLTQRESEVLYFLIRGHGIKYISQHLYVSESMVKKHIKALYEKTGSGSREDLLNKVEFLRAERGA